MPGNWHVLFGKGPTEKARATGTSPAAYFTLKASGESRDPPLSQPRRPRIDQRVMDAVRHLQPSVATHESSTAR